MGELTISFSFWPKAGNDQGKPPSSPAGRLQLKVVAKHDTVSPAMHTFDSGIDLPQRFELTVRMETLQSFSHPRPPCRDETNAKSTDKCMTNPRVSVVMPSYNHAAFVAEAIESVLSQSFTDFELIIVDDGSSDESCSVIRSFRDPRIVFEAFEKNRGAVEAVARIFALARGEYIAIMSSDDRFLPGKLEKQVEILDTRPDVIATFGLPKLIDHEGRPVPKGRSTIGRAFDRPVNDHREQVRTLFYKGNFFCHPTMLARRTLYERCGGYDPRLRQLPDYDMWCRAVGIGPLHILGEPLTEFRIHRDGGNTSASSPSNRRRDAWEAARVLERFPALPEDLLEAAFGADVPEAGRNRGYSWRVKLALIAVELTRSRPHQVFAVEAVEKAYDAGEPGVDSALLHEIRGRSNPFRISDRRLKRLKERVRRQWWRFVDHLSGIGR